MCLLGLPCPWPAGNHRCRGNHTCGHQRSCSGSHPRLCRGLGRGCLCTATDLPHTCCCTPNKLMICFKCDFFCFVFFEGGMHVIVSAVNLFKDYIKAHRDYSFLKGMCWKNNYFMSLRKSLSPSVAVFVQCVALLIRATTMVAGTHTVRDAFACVSVAYVPLGTHTAWPTQVTRHWTKVHCLVKWYTAWIHCSHL